MNDIFAENRILNEEELFNKIILRSKPIRLFIRLTSLCNLTCIMCGSRNEQASITKEVIYKIKVLLPYIQTIEWQGGEVFLLDYFEELFYEVAAYSNITQRIGASGLLIDNKWIELFNRCQNNVGLCFSIDSVDKKIYENIRAGAQFEDLLKVLELINTKYNKADTSMFSVNTVVMRSNYRSLDQLPGFCSKYNIKKLSFDFLRPEAAPDEDILIKRDTDAVEYLKSVLPFIRKNCAELGIEFDSAIDSLVFSEAKENAGEEPLLEEKSAAVTGLKRCRLPWTSLAIDQNGNISPDCLCQKNIGNIYDDDLEEVWNSILMQEYRRRIIEGDSEGWCSDCCVSGLVKSEQFSGFTV